MKIKLYYYWDTASYMKGKEISVSTHERDLSSSCWSNYILLQELEVDVPDCAPPTREDQIACLMETLDKQEADINAKAFVMLNAIKEKRQQLLALTYTPDASDSLREHMEGRDEL